MQTSISVFDGQATLSGTGAGAAGLTTPAWSYNTDTYPHAGGVFFGSLQPVQLLFDHPIASFGGWFTTNSLMPTGDVTAQFYDPTGSLIGTEMADVPPGGPWVWNGWSAGKAEIVKIVITGRDQDAYVQLDDLELSHVATVPEPSSLLLCAAGAGLLLVRLRRSGAIPESLS